MTPPGTCAAAVSFARVGSLPPAQRERLLAFLSDDERARHARLRVEADRDGWLVAHVLVRRTLGEKLGLAPEAVRLCTRPGGKPALDVPGAPPVAFSITHARGIAACAVVEGVEVGVDAEDVERPIDVERLARRALVPAELAAREALGGDERRDRFFELWTLREAIAKATGIGLGRTLGTVEITLGPGEITARFVGTEDPGGWSFALHRPTPRHVLGVAVRARGARFTFVERAIAGA